MCSLFMSPRLWSRVTHLRFLSRWDFPCLRCYSNSPLGDPDFKCPDADPEILAKSDSDVSVTPCARVWGPSSGNSNQPSAVQHSAIDEGDGADNKNDEDTEDEFEDWHLCLVTSPAAPAPSLAADVQQSCGQRAAAPRMPLLAYAAHYPAYSSVGPTVFPLPMLQYLLLRRPHCPPPYHPLCCLWLPPSSSSFCLLD